MQLSEHVPSKAALEELTDALNEMEITWKDRDRAWRRALLLVIFPYWQVMKVIKADDSEDDWAAAVKAG